MIPVGCLLPEKDYMTHSASADRSRVAMESCRLNKFRIPCLVCCKTCVERPASQNSPVRVAEERGCQGHLNAYKMVKMAGFRVSIHPDSTPSQACSTLQIQLNGLPGFQIYPFLPAPCRWQNPHRYIIHTSHLFQRPSLSSLARFDPWWYMPCWPLRCR
jgi:hypothetical protein